MIIRPINLGIDYPVLAEWWREHETAIMPKAAFLSASGFMAEQEIPVAASWLYVVPGEQGGIGVIEFTVTNPNAPIRDRLNGVKELFAHLESVAWDRGCGSLLSFVAPNGSEKHMMDKMGWENAGGVPHLIYGKARSCP